MENLGQQALTITTAPFSSIKIVINKKGYLNCGELETIRDVEKNNRKGAIWVHFNHEKICHLLLIMENGYKFHRYDENTKEFVYYKWNNPDVPDKVPKWATSIGGAGALIISKDNDKVFLVFEYGKYKCVAGSVELGELSLTTAFRETEEETAIAIDKEFGAKVCGLWNIASARPGNINDTFICYAVKATTYDFKLDMFELDGGQWFDIAFLTEAYKSLTDSTMKTFNNLTSDFIVYKDTKLSICALKWLDNYLNGRTFDNHVSSNGKINLIY